MKLKSLLALLMGLILTASASAETQDEEFWFVLLLQGEPAGWVHAKEITTPQKISTVSNTQIAMGRGDSVVEIGVTTLFEETPEGEPLFYRGTQKISAMETITEVTFGQDEYKVVTSQGARKRESTYPKPDQAWMPPAAMGRYMLTQLQANAKEIEVVTMDPAAGLEPLTVTTQIGEQETIEVFGKEVVATRTTSTMSIMPGIKTVSYIDDEGMPIKTTMDMGFMKMEMLLADEQLAKAQRGAPEIMAGTLIQMPESLPNARESTRAVYHLKSKNGQPLMLVATPSQKLKELDNGVIEVTVDISAPFADDTTQEPTLTHSNFIDGESRHVKLLWEEALGDDAPADPAARAELLRQFTYEFIDKKSLDVGMATATEVARTGSGDCTEHGVLLAALLRADGIPSRTATGLVYVDDSAMMGTPRIFGYHMWTQAWVDGKWIDLDATLGLDWAYDATHITMSTSEMRDGQWMNDIIPITGMIGNLNLEVVSFEHD